MHRKITVLLSRIYEEVEPLVTWVTGLFLTYLTMSQKLGNILTPNIKLAKKLFGNAYNIVSDENDLDETLSAVKVDANGKAELKNNSVYESIFGRPNHRHCNPRELDPFELETKKRELEENSAVRLFKTLIEVFKRDSVFPNYVNPNAMPLIKGGTALRQMTAAWRSLRLSGKEATYETVYELASRGKTDDIIEDMEGVIDASKNITDAEFRLVADNERERLKSLMYGHKVKDIAERHPEWLIAKGIDVRNGIIFNNFLSDTDRMEHFLLNLDDTKDNVKYVLDNVDNDKNPADYE